METYFKKVVFGYVLPVVTLLGPLTASLCAHNMLGMACLTLGTLLE